MKTHCSGRNKRRPIAEIKRQREGVQRIIQSLSIYLRSLPPSLYGKPLARRWTCESSGLGILRFVQTDFPTSRGTLHSGTMRWRYSRGGDAIRVSSYFFFFFFFFRTNGSCYGIVQSMLRKIGRGCQRWSNKRVISAKKKLDIAVRLIVTRYSVDVAKR